MTTIQKPWSMAVRNGLTGTVSNSQGTLADDITDQKSPLVKTAKGRWRPPTNYSRLCVSGAVWTYPVTVDAVAYSSSAPNSPYYIKYAGASNCHGNFHDNAIMSVPSWLTDSCIIQARKKLKNQQVNFGQFLGERKETAELVVSTCKRIRGLVLAVRRRDIDFIGHDLALSGKQVRKLRNSFRKGKPFDHWLELQYGWKPLLSDVHGAVTALEQREQQADRIKVSVEGRARGKDILVRDIPDSQNNAFWTVRKYRDISYKAHARFDFVQANPALATLSQLGLTNPLELAWELTPFSFVVDWFVPIGDWFSILDSTYGWDFRGGSISTKVTEHSRAHLVNGSERYSGTWISSRCTVAPQSAKGRQVSFKRTVYDTCPIPSPTWFSKLAKSSSGHVANGIALLSSAFAKKAKG